MPFKGIYPLHFEKVKKNMLEQKKAPRSIEYLVVVSSMGCDSEMLYYLYYCSFRVFWQKC